MPRMCNRRTVKPRPLPMALCLPPQMNYLKRHSYKVYNNTGSTKSDCVHVISFWPAKLLYVP